MKNKKRIIYLLILSSTLIGACLFFPVRLEGGSTCLFQYIFNIEHDMEKEHVFTSNLIKNLHTHTAGSGLDIYLRHYAFLWWSSLGLFVLSFYHLRKKKI